MLTLLRNMDLQRYTPRSYVIAATDKMGAAKAKSFEAAAAQAASSRDQVGRGSVAICSGRLARFMLCHRLCGVAVGLGYSIVDLLALATAQCAC